MIIPIFLPLLETAINKYLSLDAEMQARLQKISGKIVRVEISLLELKFFLMINDRKIKVRDHCDDPIDASLKGSPFAFFETWTNNFQGKPIISKDLEITGNLQLIQTINEIFQHIDIDWEEQLAKATGDVVAHQVGNVGRQVRDWLFETKETVTQNFSEYVQEEAQLLPPRLAIEDFCNDVDVIRDDVERAYARFQQLVSGKV